jgi:hypothetical protein
LFDGFRGSNSFAALACMKHLEGLGPSTLLKLLIGALLSARASGRRALGEHHPIQAIFNAANRCGIFGVN